MCLLAYNIILSVKCNENDTHCLVSRKYYAPCLLSIMAKRSINSSSRNCHNSLVVQRTESKSLAEFICNMKNITIYLNDIPISVNSIALILNIDVSWKLFHVKINQASTYFRTFGYRRPAVFFSSHL